MPTKLRRIAVTEDSDLASALRSASKLLPGLSAAALVKRLAIIGAKALIAARGILPDRAFDALIRRAAGGS